GYRTSTNAGRGVFASARVVAIRSSADRPLARSSQQELELRPRDDFGIAVVGQVIQCGDVGRTAVGQNADIEGELRRVAVHVIIGAVRELVEVVFAQAEAGGI